MRIMAVCLVACMWMAPVWALGEITQAEQDSSAAEDGVIAEIVERLEARRDRLRTMQIRESFEAPTRRPHPDGSITAYTTQEWTRMADGRAALVTIRWSEDGTAIHGEHLAYDGDKVRAIGYVPDPSQDDPLKGTPTRGALLSSLRKPLFEEPMQRIRSFTLLGFSIEGKSLEEWLLTAPTSLSHPPTDAEHPDDVQVLITTEDDDRRLRMTFIPEYDMAVRSFESLRNGKVTYSALGEDFFEAAPGLWMATNITVDARAPQLNRYRLEHFTLEPDVDDSLFTPEFTDGIEVVDRRFGWPITIRWEEGMTLNDPDYFDAFGIPYAWRNGEIVPILEEDQLPAGTDAPTFEALTLDGEPLALADYRGRPVLLVFWSASCEACRAMMPELVALRDQYPERDLAIIGVSLDEAPSALEAYLAETAGITWPQIVNNNVAKQYGIEAVPQLVLINAEGVIHGHYMMGPAVRAAIEEHAAAPAEPDVHRLFHADARTLGHAFTPPGRGRCRY